MSKSHKIVGLIPARYNSSRLPGKPLIPILGKPMILWVLELSSQAINEKNLYVLTESKIIYDYVIKEGYQAIMTSKEHATGTDRLAEAVLRLDADVFINIQGDEPTLNSSIITKIIEEKISNPNKVINAMALMRNRDDINNINVPKVVVNNKSQLVYMSRLPIPGFKAKENKPTDFYKQVCVYAFSRNELLKYGKFGKKSSIEISEDIEILRFLELGIPVKMILVDGEIFAVDVIEDIKVVEKRLKKIHGLK